MRNPRIDEAHTAAKDDVRNEEREQHQSDEKRERHKREPIVRTQVGDTDLVDAEPRQREHENACDKQRAHACSNRGQAANNDARS